MHRVTDCPHKYSITNVCVVLAKANTKDSSFAPGGRKGGGGVNERDEGRVVITGLQ